MPKYEVTFKVTVTETISFGDNLMSPEANLLKLAYKENNHDHALALLPA